MDYPAGLSHFSIRTPAPILYTEVTPPLLSLSFRPHRRRTLATHTRIPYQDAKTEEVIHPRAIPI